MGDLDSRSYATLYAEAINAQKPGYLPALQELHRLEVHIFDASPNQAHQGKHF